MLFGKNSFSRASPPKQKTTVKELSPSLTIPKTTGKKQPDPPKKQKVTRESTKQQMFHIVPLLWSLIQESHMLNVHWIQNCSSFVFSIRSYLSPIMKFGPIHGAMLDTWFLIFSSTQKFHWRWEGGKAAAFLAEIMSDKNGKPHWSQASPAGPEISAMAGTLFSGM